MKYGIRKPSVRKSVSARTRGRATRVVKSSINPTYGKSGMGWVNDPKKAAYNKVYNKTTTSCIPTSHDSYSNHVNDDSEFMNTEVYEKNPSTFLILLITLVAFGLMILPGVILGLMVYSMFGF